jgi:DNA (cytosine-5)-methyltransferase 1
MKYLSVCSGIEAATVAWHPLGWEAAAYSEIEKFPSQVLAHHYPDVPNVGDMTKFKEWNLGTIDLLVGGTPCQSFSVAGLRKGLDDPRGNLMLTYLAIASKFRPKWLVWENVPGVLSSNGGLDFASLLRGMGELGYGFAYRVLDAQYFGVAQRRRRVFVVGYLGDWRVAASVLFERHSLSGHPAPSREKRQSIAISIGASTSVGSLCARTGLSNSAQDAQQGHLLPIALAENTIGRQPQNGGNGDGFTDGGPMYTLNATGVHGVAQPIAYNIAPGKGVLKDDIHITIADATKTLDASGSNPAMHQGGAAILQPIPFDTTQITSKANYSKPEAGDPCHPLAAGAHPPAIAQTIAFSGIDDGGDATNDLSPTMRTAGCVAVALSQSSNACAEKALEQPCYPISTQNALGRVNGREDWPLGLGNDGDPAPTLTKAHGQGVAIGMAVRRLTPVECERLQGFPDNYTDIQLNGKPMPDGPRYKALGNSMAVPVMAWIGKRIQAYEQQAHSG